MKLTGAGVVVGLVLCLTGLKAWAMGNVPGVDMQSPLLGRGAPNFKLKLLDGTFKSLEEYRQGHNAIIFFWATWCPHCRAQLQELKGNIQVMKEKGIKLILVNVGEEAEKVKAYLQYNKIDLDVFMDEDSEISLQYGVYGLPTFYFVNRKGEIVGVDNYIPENYAALFAPSP